MHQPTPPAVAIAPGIMQFDQHLFLWRNPEVVLLGVRAGDQWSLARGWLAGDTMTDIRRWHFSTAGAFAAQVRRLSRDATQDQMHADVAARGASEWTAQAR